MNGIDQAREFFRMLESQEIEDSGEIAKRAFFIQDKLADKVN